MERRVTMKTRNRFFFLLTLSLLFIYPNTTFSLNWTWYIESTNIVSGYIDVKIGLKANSGSDQGYLDTFTLEGALGVALYDFGETGGTNPSCYFNLNDYGDWYYLFGDPSGGGGGDDWSLTGDYQGPPPTYVTEGGVLVATIRFYIQNPNGTSGVTLNKKSYPTTELYGNPVTVTYDNSMGDVSLPVQMTELTAAANREDGITIAWRTESETNCAGFHVWRSESETGIYTCITTDLIPGQGNQSIAHDYTFIDKFVQNGIVYWYKIEEISTAGENHLFGPISVMGISPIPDTFNLSQNYPNPFNPETAFTYQVPEDCDVSITIYTILGQEIKTWNYKNQKTGYYEVEWDGSDYMGRKVPSGIYLLKMQAVDFSKMRRMTVIR